MAITVGEDSYITLVEAQSYLDNEFDTDSWDNATESDKEKALKQATKKIDSQFLLYSKYDSEQTLEFPRNITIYGYNETDGVVPDKVKEAQALEALNVLDYVTNANGLKTSVVDAQKGVVSRSVKSASVTYDKDANERLRAQKLELSDDVQTLLRAWIQTTFGRC